jgi:type II secretion system protein G
MVLKAYLGAVYDALPGRGNYRLASICFDHHSRGGTIMSELRGFTLIELLIVVAIIAILAAIAVPNMLAAQARAKVSRAEADMRSIATAIESYRVDRNNYPTENFIHPLNQGMLGTQNVVKLMPLTTPVAYISNLPNDPFARKGDILNQVDPITYHYAALNDLMYPANPFFAGYNLEGVYCLWILQSSGPDKDPEPFQFPRYDPTNGTVSVGNILRTGP